MNKRLVAHYTTIVVLTPEEVTDQEADREIRKRFEGLPWDVSMDLVTRGYPVLTEVRFGWSKVE